MTEHHLAAMNGHSEEWCDGYRQALAQTQIDRCIENMHRQEDQARTFRILAQRHNDDAIAELADDAERNAEQWRTFVDRTAVNFMSVGLLGTGEPTRKDG